MSAISARTSNISHEIMMVVSYISQNKQHFNEIMMVMSVISARTSNMR